ncbi:MAG: hypothetical protein WCQ03_04250 [Phycisphaerae bacterium]
MFESESWADQRPCRQGDGPALPDDVKLGELKLIEGEVAGAISGTGSCTV